MKTFSGKISDELLDRYVVCGGGSPGGTVRLREEVHHKFEASVNCILSWKPVCCTEQYLLSKQNERQNKK